MSEMLDLKKETKSVDKRTKVDKELDLKPVESGQDGRTMAFITRVLGWDRWMGKKRKRGARKVTSCRHRSTGTGRALTTPGNGMEHAGSATRTAISQSPGMSASPLAARQWTACRVSQIWLMRTIPGADLFHTPKSGLAAVLRGFPSEPRLEPGRCDRQVRRLSVLRRQGEPAMQRNILETICRAKPAPQHLPGSRNSYCSLIFHSTCSRRGQSLWNDRSR
jgi:hypothetical protein